MHRVHGQPPGSRQHPQRGLDPPAVLGERYPAPLDLGTGVAPIQQLAQFLGEAGDVLARVAIASAGIDGHAGSGGLRPTDAIREEAMEGEAGDLRGGISERHIGRPDRDAARPMAARLLAPKHRRQRPEWIQV